MLIVFEKKNAKLIVKQIKHLLKVPLFIYLFFLNGTSNFVFYLLKEKVYTHKEKFEKNAQHFWDICKTRSTSVFVFGNYRTYQTFTVLNNSGGLCGPARPPLLI